MAMATRSLTGKVTMDTGMGTAITLKAPTMGVTLGVEGTATTPLTLKRKEREREETLRF